MSYVYLAFAILGEVIATSALKKTDQFTRLWPTVTVAVGYLTSFYCLTLVLNSIPVGVAYAVWSGMGIVLVAIAGIFLYDQIPDLPAILGMVLVIAGVFVMNIFSKTVSH